MFVCCVCIPIASLMDFSLLSRLSFLSVKDIVLALSWWRGESLRKTSSLVFRLRRTLSPSSLDTRANFSQTVLNRVFDKDFMDL